MIISENTQLGLGRYDINTLRQFCDDMQSCCRMEGAGGMSGKFDLSKQIPTDGDELFYEIIGMLGYNKENKGAEFYTVKHPHPYNYLILQGVETCAAMIRIKDNFSCSIFNKIKDGEHVYLLGKTEFYGFTKFNGAIRGCFWNSDRHVAFETAFHLEKDRYYFHPAFREDFNRMVRLMTFIELGDIEIIELPAGRNNGKPKKDGKITNTANNTVYVVDSSWNKLIIRTDGFAVKGHFRLQPCGVGMNDRKLIWIDAFEKHGYTRRPKAEIIN